MMPIKSEEITSFVAKANTMAITGGIDDAMDMYVNFRGKQPSIDPLLENRGLK